MKISIWGRCVQKWSQRSSPKTKSKEPQFVKTFWRGKITFWAMSSQVMKHGSTNTTLKRSSKLHNGRLPIPQDQKNSVSPNQESKQCWLFLILEGLFIMNLYQLDKQSTKFTWPKRFANNSWILHHDNAPAHTALSVREFLATKQITVLEHATYSPDLAPSDFFCSRRYRKYWKKGILMTSGVIQQLLWRSFHKTSYKIVLKGGLGAGISA